MLRVIDANLNRLSEGLRVLEDIARFILDDAATSERLKNLRHDLIRVTPATKAKLVAARDSAGDVGRGKEASSGHIRKDAIDLVAANAKRAQEALRVLEEVIRLPGIPPELAEREFESARYTLYDIEKELILQLTRQGKTAERNSNERN